MAYTCPWHILVFKDDMFITRAHGFKEAAEFVGCSKSAVYEYTNPRFNKRLDGTTKLAKGYEFIRIPATAPLDISGFVLKTAYKNEA